MPSRGCAGACSRLPGRGGSCPGTVQLRLRAGRQAVRGAVGAPGARVRVRGCSVTCTSLCDRAGTMPGF